MNQSPYRAFVQFGEMSDEAQRAAFAGQVQQYVQGIRRSWEISDPELRAYLPTVEALCEADDLRSLCQQDEGLAQEVTRACLDFVRDSHRQMQRQEPPMAEERAGLQQQQAQAAEDFLDLYAQHPDWETLPEPDFYQKEAKDHQQQAQALTEAEIQIRDQEAKHHGGLKVKGKLDLETGKFIPLETEMTRALSDLKTRQETLSQARTALRSHWLKAWQTRLDKRQWDWEIEQIAQARTPFLEELWQRIEALKQLKDILEPFQEELGRLWDLSRGGWKSSGFDLLRKYADLLKHDATLRELAEALGRWQQAEREWEARQVKEPVVQQVWTYQRAQKEELIGIRESNELHNMLPVEAAMLSHPATRSIFFKKYAERKLITFAYQNRQKDWRTEQEERTEQAPKATKRGPIIACVDTSGSMHGSPEQVAKVLVFALLKHALAQDRPCFLISFSTSIEVLELTGKESRLDTLVAFLAMSFHGGTDVTPALREALRKLETESYRKADVLLVSDFVMPAPAADLQEAIRKQQEAGSRFFSLVIGQDATPAQMDFFDGHWLYQPNQPESLRPLLQAVGREE
ncbi:MAG: VWA domain-containing protein [Bacteroidia bacterium]